MLRELDSVVLTNDVGALSKGTRGVIVYDYERRGLFEVEFFDDDKYTIAVATIHEDDLELAK